MPLTENYRNRYFQKNAQGKIRETGWDLVHYEGHGEMWEPVDTIFQRGASGRTKAATGVVVVADSGNGLAPFNSNVLYPLVANSTDQ